ncbi:MAG: LPXTG cell wall anchor domain-containing protein [Actinobacteria bacterium]|nr:LPXTG cell wall anchor domain-containing protein [Actinomycetota bacterium]
MTQPPVAAGGPTPPAQTPSRPATPSKPTLPATGQRQFDILLALGGAAALGSGVWLVRLAAARRPRRLH